ncbi:MAG: amidohydrolase [Bacteroidota bacterium]
MSDYLDEITNLRHNLHQHPEVSNNEQNTATIIKDFITRYRPDEVVEEISGWGIIFVFNGEREGPTLALRAELDALPIAETNTGLTYRSIHENTGHKCGHDGHMSMVAGLAPWLNEARPDRGRVILLFQPAEETGEGARRMLEDSKLSAYNPDYIFSLHNLPGYPMGQIVLKPDVFNAASKGLIIRLKGKTAHAAEPENGNSPDMVMVGIVQMLNGLIDELDLSDFGLVTVVHAQLGEPAFGVSPDSAVIMTTIRAYEDGDLKEIEEAIRSFVKLEAETNKLQWSIEEADAFQSSVNDEKCVSLLKEIAKELDFDVLEKKAPLRWSEDFGLFTQQFKGAMFGLGSGESTPDLHNPDYDFPDEILPVGVAMYKGLINRILND